MRRLAEVGLAFLASLAAVPTLCFRGATASFGVRAFTFDEPLQNTSQYVAATEMVRLFSNRAFETKKSLARKIMAVPTPSRPFVFFHQRKTGGTGLRMLIHQAAEQHKLPAFIPCHGGVPCATYEPPQSSREGRRKYVVYGGHLYWPSVSKALYIAEIGQAATRPKVDLTCLTVFREAVSRVDSCWNYRFIQEAGGPKFPAMERIDRAALRDDLRFGMSKYDEGCNNEPLRVLSDSGRAEEKVNTLTAGQRRPGPNDTEAVFAHQLVDANGWAADSAPTLYRTLEHMEQCVVGVLERCAETQEVVEFYFPWLKGVYNCVTHANSGRIHNQGPDKDQRAEIQNQNALEVFAYQAANAMLDAQLRVARASQTKKKNPR